MGVWIGGDSQARSAEDKASEDSHFAGIVGEGTRFRAREMPKPEQVICLLLSLSAGGLRGRQYCPGLAPWPYSAIFLTRGLGRPPPFPSLSLCRISMKSESHFQAKELAHKDNKDSFSMEGKYTVVSAACGTPLTHGV